jgi:GAF domain-containing protein
VLLDGKVIHVRDVLADREFTGTAYYVHGNYRTSLGVPLSTKEEKIGVFVIARSEVREFTDKQIKLVTTYADQAVVAIENARLLNELRQRTNDLSRRTTDLSEALEQQTATSEVLKVISGSPGELEPVFEAMLQKAVRICRADAATLFLFENGVLRRAARHSSVAEAVMPTTPSAKSGTMRSIATKQIIHIPNYLADAAYIEGDDYVVAAAERLGLRASLHVPMFREQEVIGAFTIWRTDARAFTEKQIELVANFAAQAVIAIENARLLNQLRQRTSELTESLEQQTATSDVLQVISSSLGDLRPVFEAMLRNATRICSGKFGILWLYEGRDFRCAALHNAPAAFAEQFQRQPVVSPVPGAGLSTLAETRQVTRIADMAATQAYLEQRAPGVVAAVELGGVENPALQAVLMALEVREAIGALTERWRRWGHDLGFGIGIAHGFATLGTIGFQGRFDYAAIGTVSNVASRLCDEAKPGQILINARVLTMVEGAVQVEPVGEFELKGIRRPLAAHNIVGVIS